MSTHTRHEGNDYADVRMQCITHDVARRHAVMEFSMARRNAVPESYRSSQQPRLCTLWFGSGNIEQPQVAIEYTLASAYDARSVSA